jgi:transposase-like protein
MLCRWVQEEQAGDGQAFRGNGKLTPDQEENRQLKAEIKRLKMEGLIVVTADTGEFSRMPGLIVDNWLT